MLVEPTQTKVATIASPRCGFVGLNPLISMLPLSLNAPLSWSSVIPRDPGATGPTLANRGPLILGALRDGPTDSRQPAARSATPMNPANLMRPDMRRPLV